MGRKGEWHMVHENRMEESLQGLDLAPIKARIFRKYGWSAERLQVAERGYREFLVEVSLDPQKPASPVTEDVDTFWHFHILDTQRYAKDCEFLFGDFLHHVPSDMSSGKTCDSWKPPKMTCDSRLLKPLEQGTQHGIVS